MTSHNRDWPPLRKDAVHAWQVAALRRYLRDTVIPFSAHYREKLAGFDPDQLRTIGDLRRIPFSSKSDITDRVKDFVIQPDRAVLSRRPGTIVRALFTGRAAVAEGFEREFRPILMTSTTGRSSEPVAFLYSQHDIDRLALAGERIMRTCGATRDMRMLNLFPFAPHLAFWQAHYAGTEFGVFMVSTGGGKTLGTEGNLRLLRKIQPDVIIGMPTFIYHVMQEAVAHGDKCPKLCKIVLGGEKAPPGLRRKLAKLAAELGASRVDVLPIFGFTESKMAWATCPPPEGEEPCGYHLCPDLGIVEVIDPKTGEPVGEGEPGEIVFTPIDARGSVVLRYRTGDLISGGVVHGPCPHCGRVVPRLVGDISRVSEMKQMQLGKLKGTLVDFNRLEHVLDDFAHIGAWQIELRKLDDDPLEVDEIVLHVQRLDDTGEEELRRLLNERLATGTELNANRIVFHSGAEMRELQGVGKQLKEQRIADNRPKADAPAKETTHA
ncbi:MAG: AMP-binding protein [Chthoniobacteraceae bacterium]